MYVNNVRVGTQVPQIVHVKLGQIHGRYDVIYAVEKKAANSQIRVDVAGMRRSGFGDEVPVKSIQVPVLAVLDDMPGLRVVVSSLIEDQKLKGRSGEVEQIEDRLAQNPLTSTKMN